jgi:hypothetical protein
MAKTSIVVAGSNQPNTGFHPMDRTPPADVRRILRQEVGFCCPIDGCGSPYLSWHHFDPPWHEREHHDPSGMIALCLEHHKQADVGTFTNAQLKQLKKASASREVKGRFNWKRETTIFKGGGSYFLNIRKNIILVRKTQTPVIWITRSDEGYDLFNIDLRSASGERLFDLQNNDWIAVPNLHDIEAPPAANAMKIRSVSGDVSLDLVFREFNDDDNRVPSKDLPEDKTSILVCEMKGKLAWPLAIQLTPSKLILPTGDTFISSYFFNCTTAIAV